MWTGPYDAPFFSLYFLDVAPLFLIFFLTSIFFSYKQHFATFYVSLYDIYTINTIKRHNMIHRKLQNDVYRHGMCFRASSVFVLSILF